jgi:hypothetical protein
MNMKQSMVFVFIVLLLLGCQNASAQQTQSPWLIGRWDGNIEGFKGEGGPARMLRVNNISAQGAIVSLWGIPPQTRGRVELKVDDSQISVFVPSSKSTVELTRESDDALVGKIVFTNGPEFPIKLTKATLSNQFDGKYSGISSVGRGCMSAQYHMTVKDSLITGWFRFHVTRGGVADQTLSADGEITGEIGSDGSALIELRGPRNSQFSGTFTGSELRAIDHGLGNRACSYELILKRG